MIWVGDGWIIYDLLAKDKRANRLTLVSQAVCVGCGGGI